METVSGVFQLFNSTRQMTVKNGVLLIFTGQNLNGCRSTHQLTVDYSQLQLKTGQNFNSIDNQSANSTIFRKTWKTVWGVFQLFNSTLEIEIDVLIVFAGRY